MLQGSFLRDELLTKLRANRESHQAIIAEARKGYIEKAKKAVAARMQELEAGKLVALEFRLSPPIEHLDEYDTVIAMLEMAQDMNVALSADQFRKFVMDEWDWSDMFLVSNKAYSATANTIAEGKGL